MENFRLLNIFLIRREFDIAILTTLRLAGMAILLLVLGFILLIQPTMPTNSRERFPLPPGCYL